MNKEMHEVLEKIYTASMSQNAFDDNSLKLVCYGTAYVDMGTKLKNYQIIDIKEYFIDNLKAECRTLELHIKFCKNIFINNLN